MIIQFEKYQGTGNDFVMLNNLDGGYDRLTIDQIIKICDRRYGVGADGLIKIDRHPDLDFEMDYYNSDGSKSFCGNGARCAVTFAGTLGIDVSETQFMAIDGIHQAIKNGESVYLNMTPLSIVNQIDSDYILNTGSPHFVRYVNDLSKEDIVLVGKGIRYSEPYKKEGINVNLVEEISDHAIRILTYERGVEDETFSCGTGATACAITFGLKHGAIGKHTIDVHVKGGDLKVEFDQQIDKTFTNIRLIGPAEFVFKGEIDV
jgi:diaminopimelate epimerase